MAFNPVKFLKSLIISQENTLTPASIQITPGGTASTTTTVQSSQTANRTLTLPDITDSVVTRNTTDALTNKTLDNTSTITGVRMASFTPDGTNTLTAPALTDNLVSRTSTDILTNKTLSGNIATNLINGSGILDINSSGTITVPNATDTLVARATTDALSNKTFNDPITLVEVATPSNPGAGSLKLYGKSDNSLYFLSSAGVETQVGAITGGTIQNLPSGTANVTFGNANTTYTFQSATGTPAYIDASHVIIRPHVNATTFGIELTPTNTAMYSLTFPANPTGSPTSLLQMDASGNMTLGPAVANGIDQSFIASGFGLTPTGSLLPFAGTVAPSGYLLCDGSAISRTTYATLFSTIGTAYGNGNNSTTFNVPDTRGYFLRGVDGTANRDPNHSTRTALNGGNTGNNPGSIQTAGTAVNGLSDSGHTHVENVNTVGGGGSGIQPATFSASGASGISTATGHAALTSTDSETRPVNLYVNYIIKY